MRHILRRTLLLLPLIIIGSIILFFSDIRNRAFLYSPKYVQEGSYFSLTIGDSADTIKPTLTALGFWDSDQYSSMEKRTKCRSDQIETPDETFNFSSGSSFFFAGSLCVSVKDGKIIEIYSNYSASML